MPGVAFVVQDATGISGTFEFDDAEAAATEGFETWIVAEGPGGPVSDFALQFRRWFPPR